MVQVIFKVPSCEKIATTIYFLVKDQKYNYRNNIFIKLPRKLIEKILGNELEIVKEYIIKSIKEKHNILRLEAVKKQIEEIWNPLNNSFFDNLKKITDFNFPFDNVIIYITEIIRGMYTPENKVFVNPMKNMTSYVIAEEILHLHYWHIFKKLIKDVEIPWRVNKEIWEISEVVPEFILTDDLFNSFGWGKDLRRKYPFIKKWKEKLLPLWKNKKNFKEFMKQININYLKKYSNT